MAKKNLVIVLSIWFLPALLYAEDQARVDTLTYILSEIQVQAAREMVTEADAPFSVFVRTRTPLEQNLEPGTSFAHLASGVPGLWVNDRHNDALGERISIRGMGWRAAFGVRGIQVLMDDIPLTVPDGQTVMDIVDPSMIQQMEIIRGPSSSFWGNASGGTLFLSTRPASFEPLMRVRLYGGSHGTYHGLASGTWLRDQRRYHVSASYLERDGFRDHSGHSILRLSGSMEWDLSQESTLQFTGAFVDAPDTRHPGALTLDEINTDRTKAADAFKNASAGKSWRQGQVGVRLQSETGAGLIRAGVYGISRSLHNPLPFADIEVDRRVAGSRISLERQAESWWTWAVGVDASIQSDSRVNYAYAEDDFNRAGRTIDQRETILNGAGYVRAGTDFRRVNMLLGVRYDVIRFENDDRLIAVEDQSGSRNFTSLNPSIGVSYNSDHGLLYVNFGTSFETPTTTELVNHPEMTGGFNPDIKPEIARGVETGFRGMWPQSLLRYEIAVFRMQVKDQLISFRTPEGGSRDFYRNAGKTRHDGLEASVRWKANHWLEMLLNYNYSHFTFLESDGSDFEEGNRLPGIPEHRLVAGVSFQHSGFRTDLTFEHTGSYYVNNDNTASNPGYELVHVRMGHSGFDLADTARWIPFIAINNVFDIQYNSSVSVNANFGRYYEPAPGRSVFLGWTLEW